MGRGAKKPRDGREGGKEDWLPELSADEETERNNVEIARNVQRKNGR